jgi:phage baseplate assembly protein gpV
VLDLSREINGLLEKYPDPRKGAEGRIDFIKRKETEAGLPRFGTVVDNKDPQCLGRVRVACDTIAPGAVTPWIQIIAPGATKETGWWQLPDIGTQVLMAFVGKGHRNPVALGCIYDLKHRPPEHSTEKVCDSKVYQSKKHRLEFIDEEGKETLIISSAKGQMRLVLSKDKGIEIANELGDIEIKCRKLTVESGEGISIEGKKKVTMLSEGNVAVKASKGIKLECDKEVKLKGKNIKLEASKGITTEGKQIAAEGDKVMGFDVHRMVVPSGNGTAVVPLPHPFIGKLADKLSKDVKIKGHNAAVKGSVAKHDSPAHNQLPGTIKFQQGPKKEGEVTGGTSGKVKINGKEAAVVGSTVTTCNDVGARDNSVVLAFGTSMPMPVIINPKNMDEYKLEREEEQARKPEITSAGWNKAVIEEGEAGELTAQVSDIEDGNMLTFQVWKEGQDPAVNIAYAQKARNVEGGAAKAEISYSLPASEEMPDKDLKFFMTVHSAWCAPFRSGNVEVRLKRPEITACEWKDSEGGGTSKGLVGEELKMEASCNGDMEEGAWVTFRVYNEGADPKRDRPVYEVSSENKGGKAEAGWKPVETREHGDKTELKYFFTVEAKRVAIVQSGSVFVKNPQIIEMRWEKPIIYYGDTTKLFIKSFEVAEFAPEVIVKLRYEIQEENKYLFEEQLTINQDEQELSVDLELTEEMAEILAEKIQFELSVEITCETMPLKLNKCDELTILKRLMHI